MVKDKLISEKKKKYPDENTMSYTIPDVKKLLKYLEGKFTKKVEKSKKKLKEEIIKYINN